MYTPPHLGHLSPQDPPAGIGHKLWQKPRSKASWPLMVPPCASVPGCSSSCPFTHLTLELCSRHEREHMTPSSWTVKSPAAGALRLFFPPPLHACAVPCPVHGAQELQRPGCGHSPGTYLWFRMRWIIIHSGLMP